VSRICGGAADLLLQAGDRCDEKSSYFVGSMHETMRLTGGLTAARGPRRGSKGAHEPKRCTAPAVLILLLRRQRFCSYEGPSQSPRPDQCVLR
jgi:hypothetical protein